MKIPFHRPFYDQSDEQALLASLPQSGPGIYRGLLPLLLAARGDNRAADAIVAVRRCGIETNRANRGLLVMAEVAVSQDGAVVVPEWLERYVVREVTGEREYTNRALAR